MSTMPIKWHQDCLENRKRSINDSLKELALLEERIRQQRLQIMVSEEKISEAIRLGKSEFDPDKFMKKLDKTMFEITGATNEQ